MLLTMGADDKRLLDRLLRQFVDVRRSCWSKLRRRSVRAAVVVVEQYLLAVAVVVVLSLESW